MTRYTQMLASVLTLTAALLGVTESRAACLFSYAVDLVSISKIGHPTGPRMVGIGELITYDWTGNITNCFITGTVEIRCQETNVTYASYSGAGAGDAVFVVSYLTYGDPGCWYTAFSWEVPTAGESAWTRSTYRCVNRSP